MSKIKANFMYNSLLTLATYIISFLVFPYVSRVLEVEYVGRIGFIGNVITYFSLFAYFGVRSLAVREIAACGDNREERSKLFSSIASFLMISTSIVAVIYFLAILFVPRFQQDKELLIIGSMSLIFNSFLLEWLYQGLENFKYVTARTILVRIIYAACVIIFIREQSDYILFYMLTVSTEVINAIINVLYSRNFVDFSFKHVNIKKYIKPILSLGVYNIMVSMYTTFNVVFLGFVCANKEVGYYYTSTKLYVIILGLFSAFTSVMLPRMSALLSEGKMEEFHNKIKASFEVVLSMSIPIAVFCAVMAPDIVRFISGEGYEGAVMPMRIIMIVFTLTSMAQIWVLQVLMPLKKDKIILYSSIAGAIVGLFVNVLIVKQMGATGTALVLLCSELAGNMLSFTYVVKQRLIKFPFRYLGISLIGGLPYIALCIVVSYFLPSFMLRLIVAAISCALYFFIYNRFIYKKTYVSTYLSNFKLIK